MPRQNRQLNSFPPIFWQLLYRCSYYQFDKSAALVYQFPSHNQASGFRHRFHSFRFVLNAKGAYDEATVLYQYSAILQPTNAIRVEHSFVDIFSTRLEPVLPPLDEAVIVAQGNLLFDRIARGIDTAVAEQAKVIPKSIEEVFANSPLHTQSGMEIPAHIRALVIPVGSNTDKENTPSGPLVYPGREKDQ